VLFGKKQLFCILPKSIGKARELTKWERFSKWGNIVAVHGLEIKAKLNCPRSAIADATARRSVAYLVRVKLPEFSSRFVT